MNIITKNLSQIILKKISETAEIPIEELIGQSKNCKELVNIRKLSIYLFYKLGFNKSITGKIFNRNHATIIWNIDEVEYLIKNEMLMKIKFYILENAVLEVLKAFEKKNYDLIKWYLENKKIQKIIESEFDYGNN